MTAKAPSWYSPETTIWNSVGGDARKIDYRKCAERGDEYLIREVVARAPGARYDSEGWRENPNGTHVIYTTDTLMHLAGLASKEFELLRRCNIQVPEVDWHVAERDGRPRLVARVAIITGQKIAFKSSPYYTYRERQYAYENLQEPGERLSDVNVDQGLVEYPITQPDSDATVFMVDIEPIF